MAIRVSYPVGLCSLLYPSFRQLDFGWKMVG